MPNYDVWIAFSVVVEATSEDGAIEAVRELYIEDTLADRIKDGTYDYEVMLVKEEA